MAARRKGSTVVKNEQVEDGEAKRPKIVLPDDYESEAEFLSDMRKDFYADTSYDKNNTDAGLDDLQFLVGNQWDDATRARRMAARKPVLTVNRLPAFLAQVIGARRMNETTIKVLPDNGGTQPIAEIRGGLIRNILKVSKASKAFDKAFEGSVACGIGNFQIEMNWNPEDVFNQDIGVSIIENHFSVVWDRMITDPTGRDARRCFVVDTLDKKTFNKRWPWAVASDMVVDSVLRGDLRGNGWMAVDDVRVVSYWRMRTKRRTLAMFTDGTIHDITDELADEEKTGETLAQIMQRPDGTPIMREVDKKYAQMYLCSGLDILEGPYNLDISRVPVIRVPGWEIKIDEIKYRWGLLRFLKDPSRIHNFARSVKMEKMGQTPRAVWTASEAAIAGREAEWRNSHLSDDPLLVWNSESGQEPKRAPPTQLEQAWTQESEESAQDMKDVSNIHEANLGMPSNEVSGAAIVARQRVSDTGTILYQDNMTAAEEECGLVINEMIDICYDTPRIIKILGADGAEALQGINGGKDNPNAPDLNTGKYALTVTTAPSTATQRIEAKDSMMAFINAAPQIAAYTLDLVAEGMDWPKHQEFARRIRMTLPPGMIDPKDMTPEMQAQAQATQQQQGAQAQLQFHMALATYLKTQSEAALNSSRAHSFDIQSALAPGKEATAETDIASRAAEREGRLGLEAVRVADGK